MEVDLITRGHRKARFYCAVDENGVFRNKAPLSGVCLQSYAYLFLVYLDITVLDLKKVEEIFGSHVALL